MPFDCTSTPHRSSPFAASRLARGSRGLFLHACQECMIRDLMVGHLLMHRPLRTILRQPSRCPVSMSILTRPCLDWRTKSRLSPLHSWDIAWHLCRTSLVVSACQKRSVSLVGRTEWFYLKKVPSELRSLMQVCLPGRLLSNNLSAWSAIMPRQNVSRSVCVFPSHPDAQTCASWADWGIPEAHTAKVFGVYCNVG
jgi:hypothetical protein